MAAFDHTTEDAAIFRELTTMNKYQDSQIIADHLSRNGQITTMAKSKSATGRVSPLAQKKPSTTIEVVVYVDRIKRKKEESSVAEVPKEQDPSYDCDIVLSAAAKKKQKRNSLDNNVPQTIDPRSLLIRKPSDSSIRTHKSGQHQKRTVEKAREAASSPQGQSSHAAVETRSEKTVRSTFTEDCPKFSLTAEEVAAACKAVIESAGRKSATFPPNGINSEVEDTQEFSKATSGAFSTSLGRGAVQSVEAARATKRRGQGDDKSDDEDEDEDDEYGYEEEEEEESVSSRDGGERSMVAKKFNARNGKKIQATFRRNKYKSEEREVGDKKRKGTSPRKATVTWSRNEENCIGQIYLEAISNLQPNHFKQKLEEIWESECIPSKTSNEISNHLRKWKKAFVSLSATLASS